MRQKSKKSLNMWLYFTLIVFGILIVSVICMVIFISVFYSDMLRNFSSNVNKFFIIPFILTGIFLGTGLSVFISKQFFKPINRINRAFKEVSKGDFTVRLPKKSKMKETAEMYAGFNSMVTELSSMETLRSDFVANISHEFKTPIAAISGYASLLANKDTPNEKKLEYLKKIVENSNRLVGLSDNILLLSKLEHQNFLKEESQYRLDEQIRKEILLLEPFWTEKEIEFDISLAKTTIFASEGLLRHVWHNLISNAIKFSEHGGIISISLTENEHEAIFKIKDNGCGMSEDISKRIFDKFYQGDTQKKPEGNGLGLSLVKRIIDMHDGKISVVSEIGKGSEFTIILSK